jgi:hypothetical protein
MSASELRQPVLLGPVACIGCSPQGPERPNSTASHLQARRHTDVQVRYFFIYAAGLVIESHPGGVSLDRTLYWTPCGDDIHLSNVRARAWQTTIPLLYLQSDVSIDADATPIPVPGAKCPPLR